MVTYLMIAFAVLIVVAFLFRKRLAPLFNFMKSRVFLINLALALLVAFGAFWGLLKWLESWTLHGDEIAAPNFVGVQVDDLDQFSGNNRVSYQIIDSVYSDKHTRGTVIRQSPTAHSDEVESMVKPDRTFYLTIVKKSVEMKTFPDLKNQSKKMAMNRLSILGFRPEPVPVPSEFEDLVLRALFNGKEITPGTKLPKGANIVLEVGKGRGGAPTAVPNLVGATIDQAKARLQGVSLFLDFQCDDCKTAQDTLVAKIHRQVPGPVSVENSSVREGGEIVVFASVAPQVNLVPDSANTGQ